MLTAAERNSLLLSLGFLLVGAGIKAWKKWRVEIGPFDPATTAATPLDKAQTGVAPPAAPGDTAAADSSAADTRALAAAEDTLAPKTRSADRKPGQRGKPKPPKAVPACPVDVNLAPEDRLANLPGVGPRTAAALAAYRKVHGPFRDIRELLQVKGIGEKKLALIAPCLILSEADAKPLPAQAGVDPERDGEGKAVSP